MKQSPARVALVLLFVFIGCFGVAYAAAGMLTALPAPAIGGTCGPSTGSETALEALAEPGSIGAGPEPSASNIAGHQQWQTFVQQCQELATRRGLASLAVLVVSLAVAAIGLIWVLRRPRADADADADASVDGAGTWPLEPGAGGPGELVGAGAAIAAPGAPAYGVTPYPGQQQAWPAQPPPSPYPYAQPVYPPAPAYPQPVYPPAPAYSAPGQYPQSSPPPSPYPDPAHQAASPVPPPPPAPAPPVAADPPVPLAESPSVVWPPVPPADPPSGG